MKYYVYMAKIKDVPIYVGKGTNNRFKHCFKKLNLDEKLILYLRYEDKKTIKEISQIFNCSGYPIKQVLKRNKNG